MIRDIEAYSPIKLRAGASLASRIQGTAANGPLVIDHFASRRCGVTVGDLRVRMAGKATAVRHAGPSPAGATTEAAITAEYLEIDPIGDVPVLVERSLIEVLARGAELKLAGPFFSPHLAVELDRPEDWLAFLEAHPANRR